MHKYMVVNKVVVLRVVVLVFGMVTAQMVPMMVDDVSGAKITVIILRKCFGPLDQRLY